MERSENLNELATALSKAQAEFKNILKDNTAKIRTKTGGEYSYSYADLASLLDMVRDPLAKNGLSISQGADTKTEERMSAENKPITVWNLEITTMLLHSSGQFIKNTLRLPVVDTGNNVIQAIGSSTTYGRRYELSSMLGIASELDDDAAQIPKTTVQQSRVVKDPKDIVFTPPVTMKSILMGEAKKKFPDMTAFQVWRVENGFAEDLSTLVDAKGNENGIEFAKIIRAVQEKVA